MSGRLLLILCLLNSFSIVSQKNTEFNICWESTWNKAQFTPSEKLFFTSTGDSIKLEQLRMYVSGFTLMKGDNVVWEENNSYHLIDFSDPSSCQWTWQIPQDCAPDHIVFLWGIDSLKQSSGVSGGDLDPMNGMYWTWQTGYIHLKLEGISNLSAERQHRFQFHIGGYAFPNNTAQLIDLPINKKIN